MQPRQLHFALSPDGKVYCRRDVSSISGFTSGCVRGFRAWPCVSSNRRRRRRCRRDGGSARRPMSAPGASSTITNALDFMAAGSLTSSASPCLDRVPSYARSPLAREMSRLWADNCTWIRSYPRIRGPLSPAHRFHLSPLLGRIFAIWLNVRRRQNVLSWEDETLRCITLAGLHSNSLSTSAL